MDKVAIKKTVSVLYGTLQAIFTLLLLVLVPTFIISRTKVDKFTNQFNAELVAMYNDDIHLQVPISEEIPIELDIPLKDLVDIDELIPQDIPYTTNVPIKTTVHINQTVNVPVDVPLSGTVMIPVPIRADVPVDQTVPVSTSVKVDETAFETSNKIIHIRERVTVDVPIELNVSIKDLGIEPRVEGLAALINTLRLIFLLPPIELNL